jgi:hypothetical protein
MITLCKEGLMIMAEQPTPQAGDKRQPLSDAERQQIRFLVIFLFRVLVAVALFSLAVSAIVALLN